jgi:hypothetical protein
MLNRKGSHISTRAQSRASAGHSLPLRRTHPGSRCSVPAQTLKAQPFPNGIPVRQLLLLPAESHPRPFAVAEVCACRPATTPHTANRLRTVLSARWNRPATCRASGLPRLAHGFQPLAEGCLARQRFHPPYPHHAVRILIMQSGHRADTSPIPMLVPYSKQDRSGIFG